MAANLSKDRIKQITNEIKMSEHIIDQELDCILRDSLNRYIGDTYNHGGHHRGGVGHSVAGAEMDVVLNEVYPIIQFYLPAIFFRNPKAFLKPKSKFFISKERNPATGLLEEVQLESEKSAKTQEHILNYIIGEIGFKEEVRKVLLDALLFPYGVLWHGYKGDFGMTEERDFNIKDNFVFVKRIDPRRFLLDPATKMANINEARWVGRSIDMPIEDVLVDKNFTITKELKGKLGFGDAVGSKTLEERLAASQNSQNGTDFLAIGSSRRPLLDSCDSEFRKSRSSRFVTLKEIYLRPNKKERQQGSKGWILVMTDEQKEPLRISNWVPKAEGFPAKILQFNALNDCFFGLADPEIYGPIADQKNVIVNLQLRNAQENSKVFTILSKEGADEEDIRRLINGEQSIIAVDGENVAQRIQMVSPSGKGSVELYQIVPQVQANLDEKSGVSELKKGFLRSGEESATSVKIRNAGSSARPAYRRDLMAEFLKSSYKYINQLDKQFFTVKDAVRISGTLDIQWSNAPTRSNIQADTDVEIDVYSMLPENPEKEIAELNTVLTLMVEGIRDPAISRKLQEEGKTVNLSPVIDNILNRLQVRNPDVFRNVRPEESQGFVSVAEIQAARANVTAILQGQPLPSPPERGQDHRTRIEVYQSVMQLTGPNPALQQLINIHTQLLEEEQKAENPKAPSPIRTSQKPLPTSLDQRQGVA